MRIKGVAHFIIFYLFLVPSYSQESSSSITCPVEQRNPGVFRKVCHHPEVNITVLRCLHDFGDVIHVNYTVDRITQPRVPPIAVDIHPKGLGHEAFICQNGSILNSAGLEIVQVVFEPGCKDPVVTINRAATVNLTLEVEVNVTFTDINMLCNTITVGPQRLTLFSQEDTNSGQLTPFIRLWNVDTCGSIGPAVPIKLNTSTGSSIVLHPDGSEETTGDISVWPLPCNDNRTQEYGVLVISTVDYALSGEILLALLPRECIVVHVRRSPHTISVDAIIMAVVIPIVAIIFIAATVVAVPVLCCKFKCYRKWKRSSGIYNTEERQITRSQEETDPHPKEPGLPAVRQRETGGSGQQALHRGEGAGNADRSAR